MKAISKMQWALVVALALLAGVCGAQQRYAYSGKALTLSRNQFTSSKIGDLQGAEKLSYQGMDMWDDYIVSLQNTGVASVYRYNGATADKISQFNLGSYAKTNHANVASFSTQFFAKGDHFPLLLVSQCYDSVVDNMKDVIYVERIANDMNSSKLVAIIHFKDTKNLCGYAVQWVVDRQNGFLYGFANTVKNLDENNKHRILKFNLPQVNTKVQTKKTTTKKSKSKSKNQAQPASPSVQVITLTEKDLLENYLLEDYYPHYFMQIGQGLLVKNGKLLMPIGLGTAKHPSILYVWDLAKRRMSNAIDLSSATAGELEDCADYYGDLIIQTQGSLYKLVFNN